MKTLAGGDTAPALQHKTGVFTARLRNKEILPCHSVDEGNLILKEYINEQIFQHLLLHCIDYLLSGLRLHAGLRRSQPECWS